MAKNNGYQNFTYSLGIPNSLFEVWEIMVLQIIITIIANVINFKQL